MNVVGNYDKRRRRRRWRCIEPVRIDRDFFERQWWGDA
jgi:hypothetical protein